MEGLSARSVRLVHEVLHNALKKAVELEYIPKNPATNCILPRVEREEIHPLDDSQIAALLNAAKDDELEHLVSVALFTGLRISELLGLTWDSVDMELGTIMVNKQLSRPDNRKAGLFASPKSGKARTIAPAPSVLAALKIQRRLQLEAQLRAGPEWDNPSGLVFTGAVGEPISQQLMRRRFAKLCQAAGLVGVRFHDLRHPNVKPTTQIFCLLM